MSVLGNPLGKPLGNPLARPREARPASSPVVSSTASAFDLEMDILGGEPRNYELFGNQAVSQNAIPLSRTMAARGTYLGYSALILGPCAPYRPATIQPAKVFRAKPALARGVGFSRNYWTERNGVIFGAAPGLPGNRFTWAIIRLEGSIIVKSVDFGSGESFSYPKVAIGEDGYGYGLVMGNNGSWRLLKIDLADGTLIKCLRGTYGWDTLQQAYFVHHLYANAEGVVYLCGRSTRSASAGNNEVYGAIVDTVNDTVHKGGRQDGTDATPGAAVAPNPDGGWYFAVAQWNGTATLKLTIYKVYTTMGFDGVQGVDWDPWLSWYWSVSNPASASIR